MLSVNNLDVFYQDLRAIQDVSFEVKKGDCVALLGSNGAGKTTILRTISGLVKPRKGEILFNGLDLTTIDTTLIANLGIAHVPEGRRVFGTLTVLENLEMGAYVPRAKPHKKANFEYVFSLFPRLYERRKQKAGSLSGGEQQMAAIGRALMSQPELLMLDEPSQGLAPIVVSQLFEAIETINKHGVSILLVEQNAAVSLDVARYGIILENGQVSYAGEKEQLLDNEYVIDAYLGF